MSDSKQFIQTNEFVAERKKFLDGWVEEIKKAGLLAVPQDQVQGDNATIGIADDKRWVKKSVKHAQFSADLAARLTAEAKLELLKMEATERAEKTEIVVEQPNFGDETQTPFRAFVKGQPEINGVGCGEGTARKAARDKLIEHILDELLHA